MNQYIAYFDYLGYSKFILNNPHEYVKEQTIKYFWNIDNALSQGKRIRPEKGDVVIDLSKTTINCLNISDTVIFWSKDSSIESLKEILEVTHRCNWGGVLFFFPLRGALVYGEFETIPFDHSNDLNTTYRINPIFGKGLISAHQKVENLNWAGSVIDNTVIQTLVNQGINPDDVLDQYAIKYLVPYKEAPLNPIPEFAFRLVDGTLDDISFANLKRSIEQNFSKDNKDATGIRAQTLLRNTLEFLSVVKKNQ